jgi:hypothetical protein
LYAPAKRLLIREQQRRHAFVDDDTFLAGLPIRAAENATAQRGDAERLEESGADKDGGDVGPDGPVASRPAAARAITR